MGYIDRYHIRNVERLHMFSLFLQHCTAILISHMSWFSTWAMERIWSCYNAICGIWHQKQISQARISTCIPQYSVNNLSIPGIHASGTKVLIYIAIYLFLKPWIRFNFVLYLFNWSLACYHWRVCCMFNHHVFHLWHVEKYQWISRHTHDHHW